MLEYKIFEPAFYHMDVPDWGTSYAQVVALGDRATVCLDTGHHAQGTNVAHIVALHGLSLAYRAGTGGRGVVAELSLS